MQIGVRTRNAVSERDATAFVLFGALSAYSTASKKALRVTKPLNILDEVKTPCITGMAVDGGGGGGSKTRGEMGCGHGRANKGGGGKRQDTPAVTMMRVVSEASSASSDAVVRMCSPIISNISTSSCAFSISGASRADCNTLWAGSVGTSTGSIRSTLSTQSSAALNESNPATRHAGGLPHVQRGGG